MYRVLLMCALFIFLSFLLTRRGAASAIQYTLTDLGTQMALKAINNPGQVIGTVTTADTHEEAFLYSNGVVSVLGTFGGTDSWGLGINDSGYVVGKYFTSSGDSHAFVLQNGQFTDLFGTAGMKEATAINNSGEIIGTVDFHEFPGSSYVDAALYDHGVLLDVSRIGVSSRLLYSSSDSSPRGLNNAGQAIVNQTMCPLGCDHSVLFSEGTVTGYPVSFSAYGINDHGQVVGTDLTEWIHVDGFIYDAGVATKINDFGGIWCEPLAINNLGQVIGTATDQQYQWHPFVYYNGTMTDLQLLIPQNPDWQLQNVLGINDRGQIIGTGLKNGDKHAFILNPEQQLVQIDIRPGGTANEVNLKSGGLLPVAILGSSVFDAAQVKPETVKISEAGIKTTGNGDKLLFHLQDVNNDGFVDFVCLVPARQIIVDPDAASVVVELGAETVGGQKIFGEVTIQLVPHK